LARRRLVWTSFAGQVFYLASWLLNLRDQLELDLNSKHYLEAQS